MMFERQTRLMTPECFGDFEEGHAKPEPADDFMGVLIGAYEHALDEGTNPAAALTAVLDWASQEIRRYIR